MKVKTRTNQQVVGLSDAEKILEYVQQNGSTTEVGGNLEVDGSATINTSLELDGFKFIVQNDELCMETED